METCGRPTFACYPTVLTVVYLILLRSVLAFAPGGKRKYLYVQERELAARHV